MSEKSDSPENVWHLHPESDACRLNQQRLDHANSFFELLPTQIVGFDCECSMAGCNAVISMPTGLYESIHKPDNRRIVAPEHVQPDQETVIEKYFDFVVVEDL